MEPDMRQTFAALRAEAEARPDRRLRMRIDPHYARVAQIGNAGPRLMLLPARATQATGGKLKRLVKDQLPDVRRDHRVCMVRTDKSIVQQHEIVQFDREEIMWAVLMQAQGAASQEPEENLQEMAKQITRALQGRLKQNQVRLLLRGEQGLCKRVAKFRHDLQRQCTIVLDTAARYGIPIREPQNRDLHQPAEQPTEQQWTHVVRKPKKQPAQAQSAGMVSTTSTKMRSTSDRSAKKYMLKLAQWSLQILEHFQLSVEGIFLEESLESSELHARQLSGTRCTMGLITVQPLKSALQVEQLSIEVQEAQEGQPKKDKLVTAFLNTFGGRIQYRGHESTVIKKQSASSTCVLRARITAEVLPAQEWKRMKKFLNPADLRKQLKEQRADLVIEDIFRLQVLPEELTCLLRVHTAQKEEWLKADRLSLTVAPVGEAQGAYKVVWDKTMKQLQEVSSKFSQLSGYMGPVLSRRGLGARFSASAYQEARGAAGLEQGNVYAITGLAVENSEQDIVSIMQETGWQVSFIPGSSHNMLTPQREVTAKFLPTMNFQILWVAFLDVLILVPVSQNAVDSSTFARNYDPTTQQFVCYKLAQAMQTFNRSLWNRGMFNIDLPNPLCGFPMDAFGVTWRLLPSAST